MNITYYGVRGSIPTPGEETAHYGGNTSCAVVQTDQTLLILDAGTGLRQLGLQLMKKEFGKGKAHILLSHMHWDHIQGFPFFIPAYVPGNEIHFYCEQRRNNTIEDIIKKQQEPPSFPEGARFNAHIHYHTIAEWQTIPIETTRITPATLLHPDGVTAYRIEHDNKTIVYATDTEHSPHTDDKLITLAADADILIYDAQYTPEEYSTKKGWGHSTYKIGTAIAQKARVKQLHLFHHDPIHDDAAIDAIVAQAQTLFPNTHAAQERQTYET